MFIKVCFLLKIADIGSMVHVQRAHTGILLDKGLSRVFFKSDYDIEYCTKHSQINDQYSDSQKYDSYRKLLQ